MGFRQQQIKHNRILDLRKKLLLGFTEKQIIDFCLTNLKVSIPTARNYFEEAAEPYRKKHWKQNVQEEEE